MLRFQSKSLLILIGVAAACAAFGWFVIQPLQARIVGLHEELQDKRSYIVKTMNETASLELNKREALEVQSYLKQWRDAAPTPQEIVQTQGRITQAAKDTGIVLQRFDPQPARDWELVRALPIAVTATGTFHQFVNYLTRVEQLDENIWITRFDVQPEKEDGKTLRCELSLSIFAENSDISN